jgi:hypothetical protein
MLPQPPPNAPAPPPSEAAIRSQNKWNWLVGVGIVSIVIVLPGLMAPMFIRRGHHRHDQTETVSNARQIGLALFEFDAEYGKYPDGSTISPVSKDAATDLNLSKLSLGTKSSNDYFRQLLAAGYTRSEKMFYARILGAKKPDDNINGAEALKKGECGFAYLSGLSSVGNPSRPLVVTPLIPGTDRFDPKPFDGKAIILKADNSVTSMNINKDGHVMLDGRNLLDPSHPIWGGHPPRIVWPEL